MSKKDFLHINPEKNTHRSSSETKSILLGKNTHMHKHVPWEMSGHVGSTSSTRYDFHCLGDRTTFRAHFLHLFDHFHATLHPAKHYMFIIQPEKNKHIGL